MARRGKGTGLKAFTEVQLPDGFAQEVLRLVAVAVDDASEALAGEVAARAKMSAAFQDYKGTSRENAYSKRHFPGAANLRRRLKSRKSKFKDGGAIAFADVPHAHLVEHGHALVEGRKGSPNYGKVIGQVKAHKFLRPARDSVLNEAEEFFRRTISQMLEGKG